MIDGIIPDTGFHLVKQLERVGTSRTYGNIAIGGIVTIIVKQLGCNLSRYIIYDGEYRQDLCF